MTGPQASAITATESLLRNLAQPVPAKTAFVEVQFSDLLSTALVLRGELSFNSAEQFSKRIDSPFRENTIIADANVRIERDGRKPIEFNLKRAPELHVLLVSFSALLLEDRAELTTYFRVTVTGNDRDWQIVLQPKPNSMQKRIRDIVVIGQGNAARCFVITQADGDISVMAVNQAATETLPTQLSIASMMNWCQKDTPT